MTLPIQLARIETDLTDARRQARHVTEFLDPERWATRPAPAEWSVAECLIHLNLTSQAFLPLIRSAIAEGRERKLFGTGPYRRDFAGWLVWRLTKPPVRFRIKTTAPFVPPGIEPKDRVLDEFDTLQDHVIACVREAAGLDLGRLRIVSPFDSRLKYNLYSCLTIIPAHQRQHLAQAEQALRSLGPPASGHA